MPLHSHFQVTLNGTRLPNFEDAINQLDQTGPIGKLITIELLPEYWPILKSGTVNLLFDDPTTGKADGYAIDFVRILVNHDPWRYAVNISCNVVDAATQKPIAKADVAAADVKATTGADGNCSLRDVPAGLVSVTAGAVGYDGATQLLDLPAGQHGASEPQLKKHKESVADLKRQIEQSGTVAIYGIHFDTASAKLRPDSLSSLNQVLSSSRASRDRGGLLRATPTIKAARNTTWGSRLRARFRRDVADAARHRWRRLDGARLRPYTSRRRQFHRRGRALNRRVEVSLVKPYGKPQRAERERRLTASRGLPRTMRIRYPR